MKSQTAIARECLKYAEFLAGSDKLAIWIKTVFNQESRRRHIPTVEYEHIVDFLVSDEAPNLASLDYPSARKKAELWVEKMNKQAEEIEEKSSDVEVVLDFQDGFKIVKLIGKNAYLREGKLMKHCVGSYHGRDTEVYSLRDRHNRPHCTIMLKT